MSIVELRRLKSLEEENRRLKRLVADLALDKVMLQDALRMRIGELAAVRVSYGYRRIHVLLLREGWKVNHKRIYRLYKQEGLTMRSKKPRRPSCIGPKQDRTANGHHPERDLVDGLHV